MANRQTLRVVVGNKMARKKNSAGLPGRVFLAPRGLNRGRCHENHPRARAIVETKLGQDCFIIRDHNGPAFLTSPAQLLERVSPYRFGNALKFSISEFLKFVYLAFSKIQGSISKI